MHINWYPGHMKKTKELIVENLKVVDLIIEILDARIPISSKNPDIEKLANKQIRNSLDRILSRWLNGSKYEYDKEKLRFNKVDENDFKK